MLEIVQAPWVEHRDAVPTLEIAIETPMKGMFQESDRLWKELSRHISGQQIAEAGASYLRFRVIDMEGPMAISVGVPVQGALAGTYACLRYIGHGLVANKLLLAWIQDQGLTMDRWQDPRGDAFRNRRETVLTDRRGQPLKKKWTMELSIKLKD